MGGTMFGRSPIIEAVSFVRAPPLMLDSGVPVITAGIDIARDRFELDLVGWGRESRPLCIVRLDDIDRFHRCAPAGRTRPPSGSAGPRVDRVVTHLHTAVPLSRRRARRLRGRAKAAA